MGRESEVALEKRQSGILERFVSTAGKEVCLEIFR